MHTGIARPGSDTTAPITRVIKGRLKHLIFSVKIAPNQAIGKGVKRLNIFEDEIQAGLSIAV